MKKLLVAFLIVLALPLNVIAEVNTHSTDLELSSSQFWSITDASQTGLDLGADASISLWVNMESTPASGDYQALVNKDNGSTQRSYEFLYFNNGGTLQLWWYVFGAVDASVFSRAYYNVNLGTATWHHIACTFDGNGANAAAKLDCYLDGSSVAENSSADVGGGATSVANSSADFLVGKTEDGTRYFDGLVDDVRVWSRTISSTDVSNMYTDSCSFSNGASNQGWWRFDNNGNDSSSNGNNLTNNNSATFSTTVAYTCASASSPAQDLIMFE